MDERRRTGFVGYGSVIVGYYPQGNNVTFRWTAQSGMVPLSDLAAVSAVPTSISSDGNVIGGRANEAFIWDEAHGMRTVRSLLESQGVNLGGWSLSEVTGLSADGSTIVGNGRDPQGKAEGWIVVIPEPSALGIAAGLLCACYRRCKRRTRANRL